MSQLAAMPFIVGVPRSGTTLLRLMLDSHPLLAIPPETGFLTSVCDLRKSKPTARRLFDVMTQFPPEAANWCDFNLDAGQLWQVLENIQPFDLAEGVRGFYRLYATNQGKPRYGEKTPTYGAHIRSIEQLLPEARFVHIFRDGRDVCLSLRSMWFAPGRDIPTLAAYWQQQVEATRTAGRKAGSYMEVRYEDLVMQPEFYLNEICRFLDLVFHPQMLSYWQRAPKRLEEHKARLHKDGAVLVGHEQRLQQQLLTTKPPQTSRIFCWKREMTDSEQIGFLRVAGATLADLGYEVNAGFR
jgi:Sulfotransferase family